MSYADLYIFWPLRILAVLTLIAVAIEMRDRNIIESQANLFLKSIRWFLRIGAILLAVLTLCVCFILTIQQHDTVFYPSPGISGGQHDNDLN